LDGTLLKRRAAAAHVKRFYARGSTSFDETLGTNDEEEVVRMPKRQSNSEDGSDEARESEDDALAADTESESGSEEKEEALGQPEPNPPQPRRSKRLKETTGDSGQGLGRRGGR
jgi:hypothetical protein